jgi:hypothetical protein
MYYFSLSLKKLSITLLFLVSALSSLSINATTEETGVAEALSKVSGVYVAIAYPKDPYIISVHVNGDTIGVIDISDSLDFLLMTHYVSQEEYQQNIKLSIAERTFIGKLNTTYASPTFMSTVLKPLLPENLERVKNSPCSWGWKFSCFMDFSFSINQTTNKTSASFSEDTGIAYFTYQFIKVF